MDVKIRNRRVHTYEASFMTFLSFQILTENTRFRVCGMIKKMI